MATSKPEVHGVLVVDKPVGITSHDVVSRVRRIVGQKSVGHAGTLDPMASGVLVVLLGEATKLTPWLTSDAKVYTCTLQLGVETSSGDADGSVVREAPLESALSDALRTFAQESNGGPIAGAASVERARTSQVPPAISAIHVNGERAYERVRRGEEVVLEARPVAMHELRIESVSADDRTITCMLHASKGYYVRAFARDFASTLGTFAHLTMLRRMRSGSFLIDDAVTLEGLTREQATRALCSCEASVARAIPTFTLTEEQTLWARQGKRFAWPSTAGEGPHGWLDAAGALVAVGESREGLACVIRGFCPTTPQVD